METLDRKTQLHQIAQNYVKSLGSGDFMSIPYHDQVTLRAPINPGGSGNPMEGKETLRKNWWAPLPDLVESTQFIGSYINDEQSAVAAEFLCRIKQPACTLRIIDRFKIDDSGKITDQENFFDPRSITNPV